MKIILDLEKLIALGVVEIVSNEPKAKRNLPAKPKEQSPASVVWQAYSDAYEQRWGSRPPTSAKGYSLCKQLVSRIGQEEAVEVARFYVAHPRTRYIQAMHPLQMLIYDAEPLFAQWKAGRPMTDDLIKKYRDEVQTPRSRSIDELIAQGRDPMRLGPAVDPKLSGKPNDAGGSDIK